MSQTPQDGLYLHRGRRGTAVLSTSWALWLLSPLSPPVSSRRRSQNPLRPGFTSASSVMSGQNQTGRADIGPRVAASGSRRHRHPRHGRRTGRKNTTRRGRDGNDGPLSCWPACGFNGRADRQPSAAPLLTWRLETLLCVSRTGRSNQAQPSPRAGMRRRERRGGGGGT